MLHRRSLTQNAQRRSSGYTMELFVRGRFADQLAFLRARQNFDYSSDQIVGISLRDFHASSVAGVRESAVKQLDVRQIQFAVYFGRHALQAGFPNERIVL